MSVDLRRRAALAALAAVALVPAIARAQRPLPEVVVYKSPTCGCCNDWIKHLQANGFTVKATNVPDSRFMRARFGMPSKFASCHTALVGGYVLGRLQEGLFLWLFGTLHQHPGFLAGLHTPAGNSGASLMLFMLCAPVMTFWLTPLGSLLSRRHEFQADAYACRHSSAADLIAALTLLYRDNASTLTPDPLHSAFYDSHPPASLRIARLQGNHHEPA